MAVYTPVARVELDGLLARYAVGSLRDFEGIADGIENTNYAVDTSLGRYVLTIFESLNAGDLAPYLKLQVHLCEAGLPCPRALFDRFGKHIQLLHGKPAALFERLPGTALASPSEAQCRQIGLKLARLHECTADYAFPYANPYDPLGCEAVFRRIADAIAPADRALIEDELAFQKTLPWQELPQSVIHGDLFRDNVLFQGERATGLLDFYSASRGPWLFDLAVAANDWCADENGMPDAAKTEAMLSGYRSARPLTACESIYWPGVRRAAALRFWLSRLKRTQNRQHDTVPNTKDPGVFRRLLLHYRTINVEAVRSNSTRPQATYPSSANKRSIIPSACPK